MDQVVVVKGWRRLGVRRWGVPGGTPVVLFHGTPGCRISARPSDAELQRLGVELVTYDRPGYGLSDPHPGRSVADAAEDVRVIADSLKMDRFAVIGKSGGGPHALACAALMPERVTRVAALVSLAPFDAEDLDWFGGMVDLNRDAFGAAVLGMRPLARMIFPRVQAMRSDPEHFLRQLQAEATPHDRQMLGDPAFRAEFVASVTEAVGRSLAGWVGDSLALTRPWGFELQWIKASTLLWHIESDTFVPETHARWLAGRIRDVHFRISRHAGHIEAVRMQRDAIKWLVGGQVPERAAG
jgi:pimeloyl-ACP methyl ester carboxylesterase